MNTLAQALDLCDILGDNVGVAIDTYNVWWDPQLDAQIARAGIGNRIMAYHICDWLVPTRDFFLDRGMMGDGVIDLPRIRRAVKMQVIVVMRRSRFFQQTIGGPSQATKCCEHASSDLTQPVEIFQSDHRPYRARLRDQEADFARRRAEHLPQSFSLRAVDKRWQR